MKDTSTTNEGSMGKKFQVQKGKKAKVKRTDPYEALKLEIAAELGLIEQVQQKGWQSLSARDAGKIGGLLTHRKRRKEVP